MNTLLPSHRHAALHTARTSAMNKKTFRSTLPRALWLTSLAAACAPALAQGVDPGYFYGGASIGQSRARIDEARIAASLQNLGLTTTAITRENSDTGYKAFLGYQMTPWWALEASYFRLGRFSFQSTTAPAGTLNGNIRLDGLALDLVGTLPLSEQFALIGRVGAQNARARDSFAGTGAVVVTNPNPQERKVNLKYGGGLQWDVAHSFLLRAEGERYHVNDAVGNRGSVNLVSLSVVIPFGHAPAPAPRTRAAPAYVEPTPAPPPVVMAPPAPPPPAPPPAPPAVRKISFSADSLFTFDRAEIRPEGRAALDPLAREVTGSNAGARFEVIEVTGHTDRLGTEAYNQRLSTRRAEAVKAYLVTAGIEASRIAATGKGETQPITQPGDCKGKRPTPKLIACLQPDRRVEVLLTGTR